MRGTHVRFFLSDNHFQFTRSDRVLQYLSLESSCAPFRGDDKFERSQVTIISYFYFLPFCFTISFHQCTCIFTETEAGLSSTNFIHTLKQLQCQRQPCAFIQKTSNIRLESDSTTQQCGSPLCNQNEGLHVYFVYLSLPIV
jgi:hypothetical protein